MIPSLREFIEGLLEGDVSKVSKHVRTRRNAEDNSFKISIDEPVLENLMPLFVAVQGKTDGHVQVIRHLIKRGCKTRDTQNRTPLHRACVVGNPVILKVLLSLLPAEADAKALDQSTPLGLAAQCGSVNCVDMLLKFGCRINTRTVDGATPLLLAVTMNRVKVVERLLKEPNVNVSLQSNKGMTPLYISSKNGTEKICSLLLDHLDSNSVDASVGQPGQNSTALMAACQSGSLSTVQTLVIKGKADTNTPDDIGRTPLYEAAGEGALDIVNFLLDHGAKVDPNMENQSSPLFIASLNGHVEVAKALIDFGADVYKRDVEGRSIFEVACGGTHSNIAKILRLLIESGAREERWSDPILLQKRDSKAFEWAKREKKALLRKHDNLLKTTNESIQIQKVIMADALTLCRKIDNVARNARETAEQARFGLGNVQHFSNEESKQ